MNIQKLMIFSGLFLSLFMISCNKNSEIIKQDNIQEKEEYISMVENDLLGDIEKLVDMFPTLEREDLEKLSQSVKESDFVATQEILPEMIESLKKEEQPDTGNVKVLTYNYISAVLNEGTYSYKEKEKAQYAIDYLETLELEDPIYVDPVYSNYYLGYASEIIKEFEDALNYYNKGLSFAADIEKNNKIRSILLNQKGHLYDLMGEKEQAYKLYLESYSINKGSSSSSVNIARYLARNGEYNKAKEYFEYALSITKNNALKSEIYYSLSSIELETNDLTPDIEASIESAKKSIENYPEYPMGYLALARGLYMLNDVKYDEKIIENLEKSIALNPYGNEAYKFYSLYFFDKKDLEKSLFYLRKAKEVIDHDMILMEDQRMQLKYLNDIMELYINYSIEDLKIIFDIYENDKLSIYIKQQLKRKNNGIYHSINNMPEFSEIIAYYLN